MGYERFAVRSTLTLLEKVLHCLSSGTERLSMMNKSMFVDLSTTASTVYIHLISKNILKKFYNLKKGQICLRMWKD